MTKHAHTEFLVLYGSQTGQAQAISEEIFDRAHREGLTPKRFCLDQVDKKFCLEKESCAVIVCSTTGEGETPDNAIKFVRRIKKKTLSSKHLAKLSFAFLALGDSNYTNFCNCGKAIDDRLQQLGAVHFYETGYGDDAVGLEIAVEPWIDGLFVELSNTLNTQSRETITNKEADITEEEMKNRISKPSQPVNTKTIENATKEIDKTNGTENTTREDEKKTEHSLLNSVAPLKNSNLKIPTSPEPYIELVPVEDQLNQTFQTKISYPNAVTEVKKTSVVNVRQLTFDAAVKKAFEVELNLQDFEIRLEPGDSFGIVCNNNTEEVDYLLKILNVFEPDKRCKLTIRTDTKKKDPKIPDHIPEVTCVRNILLKYVDFRAVPRKALLRMLVDYTSDEMEKRRLQELCSTQGTKDFGKFIRDSLVGVLDLLKVFSSCQPPVERLIELLPRLLPREYSVASWAENSKNVKFVFNLVQLPGFQQNERFGLCTRMLSSLSESIEEKINALSLDRKVNVYLRRPTNFRFPDDVTRPLVMVGPGTGVAPFIAFLQKRKHLLENSVTIGDAHLFYGCRYRDNGFIYKDELMAFKSAGVLTEIYTAFSRESDTEFRYVQDNMKCLRQLLMSLIFEQHAAVYVCGDAKNMGRDVTNTLCEMIEQYKNVSKLDALKVLATLRENKQFLEDTWT